MSNIMVRNYFKEKDTLFAIIGFVALWVGFHVPGILYGTHDTPLHVSYMTADEQSPINGALHMLKEKSILGLKNQNTLYYGPIFSLLAVPAVLVDFSTTIITGNIDNAQSYKDHVVWDWGGALIWARLIAVLFGAFGLFGVFLLFKTETINPTGNKMYPFVATALLASNFMFFEYSNFFRHWVFVVTFLIWQILLAIKVYESPQKNFFIWFWLTLLTAVSFGISYVSIMYLVFWTPILVAWCVRKDWTKIKYLSLYVFGSLIGFALVVWWHPYAFIRYFGQLGLTETGATGASLDMLPETGKVHSFFFYARVVFMNTFLLLPLGVGILFAFVKEKLWKQVYVWVLVLPALVNYIVFSIPSEPESRYMLPTVVFSTLLVLALYFRFREKFGKDTFFVRIASGVLILSFFLGSIQIVGWQRIILDGPPERREIGPLLEVWREENPDQKILVQKNWPLGYVHTHEAYADYIARYDKSSYDLWKYILTLTPPEEKKPINVYYLHSDEELTSEIQEKFDHVVRYVPPQIGSDLQGRSPYDEFDLRPWHMWDYKKYQDTFEVLK